MKNDECHYCHINKPDLLFETDQYNVLLAPDQSYLGRLKIVAKRHVENLSDLSEKEGVDFFEIVDNLENALKETFSAVHFNWTCFMNDAYKEEIPNPHVHWHMRPRYNKDVNFSGEIFTDPEFAHHYDRARKKEISKKVRENIKREILKNIR